jgi:hypothetical protein
MWVACAAAAAACAAARAPARPAQDAALARDAAGAVVDVPAPEARPAEEAAARDLPPAPTPRDAAAPPTGCADLPLCDDFEGPAAAAGRLDPARWSIVTPNCSGTGALSLDTAQHHSGARSVKVVGPTGYCNHVFMVNTAALPQLGPVLYGRLFVRLAQPLGPGHVTIVAMKDAADGGKDLRLGGQMSVLSWNRESDDATLPALGPMGVARTIAPPAGQWLCLEFMIDGDGRLATWIDGNEIEGLRVGAAPVPEISDQWLRRGPWRPRPADLKIGFEGYDGANTVWFDDVALASARIGCR